MVERILRYFPFLSDIQIEQYSKLKKIYEEWNIRINVISRRDMDNFYIHHVLHSLSLAKFISFTQGTKIVDVGTGGGFPGIPLAIMFPSVEFTLIDSIEKKIRVVNSVSRELDLTNVIPLRKRIEDERNKYDFVVSRAVSEFALLLKLTGKNIDHISRNKIKNGIICLKGGNLDPELAPFMTRIVIREIKDYFSEPYFKTKKIVYLPA